MKYLYNPPLIIKKIYKHFYWQTSNNKILLTFDDGPNPGTTEKILYTLNKLKIKALHFCVGENLERYKELVNKILNEGHTIGNHTYYHRTLTSLSSKESLEEINSLNSLMKNDYSCNIKYFRPPFGRINFKTKKIMNEADLRCVMWNLLTYDYNNDIKRVKFSVDNYLQNNSIIVLHDSNKTNDFIIDSIKYIADTAAAKGFEFGVPEECLN
ncbi:MAG: polysaccharide deacetylase family protein [Bacteroidetes bacterium]|nr:polysaccharide deacetylase family protein [Bacteroidota bacterium]MCH8033294.1 polysaccharide deacetylase family protein [Bacteroidota bacterium]